MTSRDDDEDVWRKSALSLSIGAVLWEVIGRAIHAPLLPPFSTVVSTLIEMARNGQILQPLAMSLASLILGLSAATVVGILVGVLMARSETIGHLIGIYFDALMAAPTLTYVPVLFAFFGVTRATQVAVVFTYAFFVIAGTTCSGVRAVDQRLVDMANAFGASERQVFWTVALPGARPFVLTGLELGTTRAVKGMVVGEMMIALSGLGAMLRAYGAQFDIRRILALLLVIVLVAVGSNVLVGALGRRFLGRRSTPVPEPVARTAG